MRSKVQSYFVRFIEQSSERKFLLYWFTKIISYPKLNSTFNSNTLTMEVDDKIMLSEIFEQQEGKNTHYYIVVSLVNGLATLEHMGTNLNKPLLIPRNDIELLPGEMENFKGPKPIITSPALMVLNQRILVESFGNLVPYEEIEFTPKSCDALLASLLMEKKVTPEQGHLFQTNAYDLGYFGELCNKGFSSRTWTTDPKIKKLRHERFLTLSEDDKKNPLKLAEIEDELCALDKAWAKQDPTCVFHDAQGSKSYAVHRKKMFVTTGAIPAFTDKGEASYVLVENSLTEGLQPKNFPAYANEIYKGSYDRGLETAKGGELTKYVQRVYQDLIIAEQDCKTSRGAKIELHPDPNAKVNLQLLGRNLLKTNKPLTKEDLKAYAGKIIEIRDPACCKTQGGLCFKCAGTNFEKIGERSIGSYIVDISSAITMVSMKNMHGVKLTTIKINPADFFITT